MPPHTVALPSTPCGLQQRPSDNLLSPLKERKNLERVTSFRRLVRSNAHSVALGGHRGMGKNVIQDEGMLACGWRENTVKSFLKAAECGATFIEFDVQLTKDNVPVVWHDDFITFGDREGRSSVRIRDITFEEFRSVGHRRAQGGALKEIYRGTAKNAWRCTDEDELPSLEQVFEAMPSHVAFNVELKTFYDPERITPEEEIDDLVSAVLGVVDVFAGGRTIAFSSFDPDVVRRLKHVQSHAVLFLSAGENAVHTDPRRTSLLAAIEWAEVSGLDGLVVDTAVLRLRHDIVAEATGRGLLVMTYGSDNDDPNWISAQHQLGVHGAIVDDVIGIARKFVRSCVDSCFI